MVSMSFPPAKMVDRSVWYDQAIPPENNAKYRPYTPSLPFSYFFVAALNSANYWGNNRSKPQITQNTTK
jgi:hypothetical protein